MNSAKTSTIHKPVIEHLHDLRKHLLWVALAVAIGSGLAYSIHQRLFTLLQAPLHENLYYTSPTGGFTFLFKLCIVTGIIFALPVIIYHFIRFFEPLLDSRQKVGIIRYVLASMVLAAGGIAFAYFISLPAALKFLMQFGNDTIQSLIGLNEYFNFAIAYVVGFAVLFQLPIIILFINRIKPLTPRKMFGMQRYIILGGFIIAAILTPTPDPFNQLMMALPIVVLYQVAIVLVWLTNRKRSGQPSLVEEVETLVHHTEQVIETNLIDPVRHQIDVHQLEPAPAYVTVNNQQSSTLRKVERKPITAIHNTRQLVGNDFF